MAYFQLKRVGLHLDVEVMDSTYHEADIQIEFDDKKYFETVSGISKFLNNYRFVTFKIGKSEVIINTDHIVGIVPIK